MQILHISAECYPAAKAGGLGDVVGALPKYLNQLGVRSAVAIPKYQTKWINQQSVERIHLGYVRLHNQILPFAVERVVNSDLGFDLFVIDIPGRFDRPGVYADPLTNRPYRDEVERALSFQKAVLGWVLSMKQRPKILHCHDHHTGLIPFFITQCPEYEALKAIPTVFTIHNGRYHGAFDWDKTIMFPAFPLAARGLLDWNGRVNPLATAIKTCWKLTTVSRSYLEELWYDSDGLEHLLRAEAGKSSGIINGIDTQVWNPATDSYLSHHLENGDVVAFKAANKKALMERFYIHEERPLITFVGRLVGEKGADLIPDMLLSFFHKGYEASFVVLGTGEPWLEDRFRWLKHALHGHFDVSLEYNEGLAHQLYAGSDFMLMPSRVEPCGLNQMYAMRYGTVPIVRSVGGLKDTVPDISEPDGNGRGIRFNNFSVDEGVEACHRAVQVFKAQEYLHRLQHFIMQADFSWEQSAQQYIDIYNSLV